MTEDEVEGLQHWPDDREGSWKVAVLTWKYYKPQAQGKKPLKEEKKWIMVFCGILSGSSDLKEVEVSEQ